MKKIMNLAHRLASMVASNMIALAYNPYQAEIFQLLWNIYDLFSTVFRL